MISSHAKSETNQNAARIGRGREWRRPWRRWCWWWRWRCCWQLGPRTAPPPPCTVSLWGRGSDFALLFLVRDKTLFSFVFFCFILFSLSSLVFAFAFVMAYVMKRVAHIETTLSHKTLVSGRVSRSEFIDFLHAPCGNVWQTRNVATATNFYSLFTFCYSLFVLALVLHIRIE